MKKVNIKDVVSRCETWNPRSDGDGQISYIDLSSVDKSQKCITSVEVIDASVAPSRAKQIVKTGDVLVATVRPNLNGVAIVESDHDLMTASTGYCVLRPQLDKLHTNYLFQWVKTEDFVSEMVSIASGANYPAVSDSKVKNSKIPLPPLEEQKRIAAILDDVDESIQLRKASIDALDELIQSTFISMFGDPVTNPMGWEPVKMGDIVNFKGGSQPAKKFFEYEKTDTNVRFVQIRDFKSDKNTTYIPKELAKRPFDTEDVMIARYGPPVFQILKGLSGSYNVALMKAEPLKGTNKTFIFHLLNSQKINHAVVANSERSAGQTGVNLKFLNNFKTYDPPLNKQQEFAAAVESIEEQKTIYTHQLKELENLFGSLQQRAFKGEL